MADTNQPLTGVKILDLTHVLAGPYATGQLALMGAEVIRIERPGGDDFVRSHGGTIEMRDAGLGASFLSQNSGKKSVVLDLKVKNELKAALSLVEQADILVQNFRPGVAERLGLGFSATTLRKPNLIYASLSGYGPDGPLASRPAYDHILQGMSGLMAMTGSPESGPLRVGIPIVDYVAGQSLVSAILAALLQRAKQPETPQELHVSMFDAITNLMGAFAVNHQTTGNLRGLEGNRAFSDSPFSGRFDCADGQLVITANTPAQTTRLCQALGRPDLEQADAHVIAESLAKILATQPASHWDTLLAKADVPAGPILHLGDALAHPQMENSPCWNDLPVPELGLNVRVPGLSFRAPWAPSQLEPAPTFGRDTDEVLSSEVHE